MGEHDEASVRAGTTPGAARALWDGLEQLSALRRGLPAVEDLLYTNARRLWFEKLRSHFRDSYAGVAMYKFPEDLRVYEHLLWASRPNVVIEIGAQFGGSALWFRDRLMTLAQYGWIDEPRVISIDVDVELARGHIELVDPGYASTITLVEGDVRSAELPDAVAELVPDGATCLVVEDSAHLRETTLAALNGFSRFVSPGGFFVVEDGCVDVDAMRPTDEPWPRGVMPAVREWLGQPAGRDFTCRRDLELYGITCHPGGFLQRN